MRRSHILAFTSIAIAAGAFAIGWIGVRPAQQGSVGPVPTLPAAASLSIDPTPIEPTPAARTALDVDTKDPTADPIDFDALLARLVALATRGVAEVRAHDIERAKGTDAEAKATFEQIVLAFADAGERALFHLTGAPDADADDTELTAKVERAMLLRLVDYTLQARHARGPGNDLDTFVTGLLDAIEQGVRLADDLAPLLIDKPFLGLPHENPVLRLAELSPVATYLQPYAARLIVTLWDNLARTGARSRTDLATVALMLKDDSNPAKRSAAMQRLLGADDERLVDFVLTEVEQKRDGRLARELALSAAEATSPARALAILQRMRRVEDSPLTGATLTLALRDPASLRSAYEGLVGEGRDAALRADVITALGFNPSPENSALTRLAFDSDPDPGVRARALLALSAKGAQGEQVIEHALGDVSFLGAKGERLPDVIAAIHNLAGAGDLNAVARLGRRVLARPELAVHDRADLEQLLANTLPPELRRGF